MSSDRGKKKTREGKEDMRRKNESEKDKKRGIHNSESLKRYLQTDNALV